MSESNNVNPKKTSAAKKTFIGLAIFAIICVAITYACIYLTLENRSPTKAIVEENQEAKEIIDRRTESKYKTLKLTDKSYLNGIIETKEEESYGEVVDYYAYDNSIVQKLEIDYVQISGLKDRNVQATINQAIKDKVDEIKESYLSKLEDSDVDRICINATVWGNFSDVISIQIEDYIHYDYNDENYDNDSFDSHYYGLNFSLSTGEQLKFRDMFWEDSPVKTILSQSIYKELAWKYAFAEEDLDWDWNMDNLDYSGIESKVYNFMYKYNKNPDIEFYFTTSSIQIPYDKDTLLSINMADFYEYIAIYTKYKSNENLYEDASNQKEFYVFANYVSNAEDYVNESGKRADNIYYTIYCYDILENISNEGKEAFQTAYRTIIKKLNEYVKELKNYDDYGYIIEGYYTVNDITEYNEKAGYNLQIEVASCSREYFDKHLEDALATGARAPRVDIVPTNYVYIDKDNFEFYESYVEWMEDYTDATSLNTNTYTREDRDKDMEMWENPDEEFI